jgi:hypothetical protein
MLSAVYQGQESPSRALNVWTQVLHLLLASADLAAIVLLLGAWQRAGTFILRCYVTLIPVCSCLNCHHPHCLTSKSSGVAIAVHVVLMCCSPPRSMAMLDARSTSPKTHHRYCDSLCQPS